MALKEKSLARQGAIKLKKLREHLNFSTLYIKVTRKGEEKGQVNSFHKIYRKKYAKTFSLPTLPL